MKLMLRTETELKRRWRYGYAIIPSRKEHDFGQISVSTAKTCTRSTTGR